MPILTWRIPLYTLPVWLALCGAAGAETITVSGGSPVAEAAAKLEDAYGWAITYEPLPLVYEGDLRDVTSESRKDGKSAGPGIPRILAARRGTFSFSFDPPSQRKPGTRAPEGLARGAILDMLKSYSESIGGVEAFTLTDSNGLFHIIPTQRRGVSGQWEKIEPLLDTPVSVPPGRRTGLELLNEICRSLASQTGVHVGFGSPAYANMLATRITVISSTPNETARSILSRFAAEQAAPRPISWRLGYPPSWGYMLSVRILDAVSLSTAPPARIR